VDETHRRRKAAAETVMNVGGIENQKYR